MANNTPDQPVESKLTQLAAADTKVHDSLLDDAVDAAIGVGRVAEVTLVGGLKALPAAGDSFVDHLRPSNWGNDLVTVAQSAAAGVILRTVLPKSGAVAKTAGIVMTAMFAKDGLVPTAQAWKAVWQDHSDEAMHKASSQMGNALGEWAIDGGLSMAAAGWTAKRTPGLWNKVAPETWNKIESFKDKHLAGTAPINTGLAFLGDRISRGISAGADRLDPPKPSAKDIPPEELAKLLEDNLIRQQARTYSEALYRNGLKGANGIHHGLTATYEMLVKGIEPRGVIARADDPRLTNLKGLDLAGRDRVVVSQIMKPDTQNFTPEQPAQIRAPRDQAPAQGDVKPIGTGENTDWSRVLNVQTMTEMANVIRTHLAAVSDEEGIIKDHLNFTTGAVWDRTNPNVKFLLGYDEPMQSMLALAREVDASPGTFVQVADLFQRFAHAAVQHGATELSDIGQHVGSMNVYASENYNTYVRNMLARGIDVGRALMRKVVPPLVETTSDVRAPGEPHEGPHTVRAIYGPNGEPIWPIDLVKYPIRELALRAILTAPIYAHEFMHDQFGRLGEFDPAVREAKLGEAADKAFQSYDEWKAAIEKAGGKVPDEVSSTAQLKLPNGGVEPQQVLLKNVERAADGIAQSAEPGTPPEKIQEAREQFLSEALRRDQQSRVFAGARASSQLLGATGRRMVQVPGNGAMPLDIFIANVAAMADTRSASEVLLELQGQGDPVKTEQNITQEVKQRLGSNGAIQLARADGTPITLEDAVLQVSRTARNPKFRTYDKPLPEQVTMKDILMNVAKGWADETFADWGAAAENGESAAPYFQALRRDGLLSTGTVMGQEMRGPDNELGIEAHPVDKTRPRYQAALIRALATANGGNDKLLLDWAKSMEQYSRDAGQPGPIVIADMDAPGQKIAIPEELMDSFINELVQQQLNTPLPSLQGHTLFDILPDLRKNFRINLGLADQWVDAITHGKGPETIPLDKSKTKQMHVYGAGPLAFLKLTAMGIDGMQANDAVLAFNDHFSRQFLTDDPHASTPFTARLQLAPMHTLGELPSIANRGIATALRTHEPVTNFVTNRAHTFSGAGTSMLIQDLLDMHQAQLDMLNSYK